MFCVCGPVSTTQNMDGRDNGYDWWMGIQTYGWQSQGYIPFSLSYTRATHSASCFLLSSILRVCLSFNQRRGAADWMGEWVPHTTWMTEGNGMHPCLCHGLMRPPFRQPLSHPCFFVFCVLPSFNRGGYGWLDSAGWMGSTRNMDGRGNGRQKGGYIPFFLTCLCATPIQPALLSAIHVLCVWSPFNQRKEEYGWLNGHHTQHRWKRQGVRLVEWVHTWMTERMDMYPSFCHSRVRPRFSQPHPSLCFCVWPLFNRRRSMEGWMGTTSSVDERDKGVWLVEWGQTHG